MRWRLNLLILLLGLSASLTGGCLTRGDVMGSVLCAFALIVFWFFLLCRVDAIAHRSRLDGFSECLAERLFGEREGKSETKEVPR